jgi:hypothetical protein
VELLASQRGSFEGQLKHKYKRKVDYARHCDASDHALAAMIIKAPDEENGPRAKSWSLEAPALQRSAVKNV